MNEADIAAVEADALRGEIWGTAERGSDRASPTWLCRACQLGLEGIVSKRIGSRFPLGSSLNWIKSKNRATPALRRQAEEDWGR
jgi:hypothetical protein